MINLPHSQSFWIVEGSLLAGNYPSDKDRTVATQKLRKILDAGVTAFVDLTQRREPLRPYEEELEAISSLVPRAHFPIHDVSIPASPQQMRRILDFIDAEIERGGCVYLHCWGGHGRTGTVVGCWLRRHGRGQQQAIEELQRLWQRNEKSTWGGEYSVTPQTAAQRAYIQNWTE